MNQINKPKPSDIHLENARAKSNHIAELVNAVPRASYCIDICFRDIENQLENYQQNYNLDLDPDFQRGYKWTREQQIHYIECYVRGVLPEQVKTITFNCNNWDGYDSTEPQQMVLVDGKQRLNAVRSFLRGDFKIFSDIDGGVSKDYFRGTRFTFDGNNGLKFSILSLPKRIDYLRYYKAFNTGGTVHTVQEIELVDSLIEIELSKN
jgi:hypothetical protein